jgi:hypothetical protein
MALNNPYVQGNTSEREHLVSLVNRLTDDKLSCPLEVGWTVSAVLAHLAFWDQRALTLLNKWKQDGIGPSPMDTDIVNEAMRLHCLAIPPRGAARLAIDCAAAIDQEIEQLAPAMLADVETNGKTVRLDRAHHRRMHLEQIEQALGISGKK